MDRARKRKLGNRYLTIIPLLALGLVSCKDKEKPVVEQKEIAIVEPKEHIEFGFNFNDYVVKRDTVKSGESFGQILERNKIGYPQIFHIAETAKETYDIARYLQKGRPYTLLCSKDSLEIPEKFIYQPSVEEYIVVSFKDSIHAYKSKKPIKYVEKVYTGVINSNISQTLDDDGLSLVLAYKMSDIYAWTIDFTRLQKGDRFKVIYTDKYIDDTIYAGINRIKAAYFEHNSEPFYAFRFKTDSVKGLTDF